MQNTSAFNLLWSANAATTLPALILGLVLAAVLAFLLGRVYLRFGSSLSNRRVFARQFVLLAVTTTLIISIVKSSLALSLGLVEALSIVRFRAAIKEPEELAYLFLAISIGLGMGAGQIPITVVAFAIITLMIVVRGLARRGQEQPNLYLTVQTPADQKLGINQILAELTQVGAGATLKRFDESPESIEAMFHVSFPDVSKVEELSRRLRERSQGVRVSYLEDRGLSA